MAQTPEDARPAPEAIGDRLLASLGPEAESAALRIAAQLVEFAAFEGAGTRTASRTATLVMVAAALSRWHDGPESLSLNARGALADILDMAAPSEPI